MISGRRLIEADLADVAIVGGADTLSRMPVNGFHSLESLSVTRCQPLPATSCGITIGEGAALMLLTREPAYRTAGRRRIKRCAPYFGPHPQGEGAIHAITRALDDAGITAGAVLGLHQPARHPATPLNDRVESQVVRQLFGDTVPCSSTKHLTGHALGAAGSPEAAIRDADFAASFATAGPGFQPLAATRRWRSAVLSPRRSL